MSATYSGNITRWSLNKIFACPADTKSYTNTPAETGKYPIATNIAMTTADLEISSGASPAAAYTDKAGRWGGSTAGVPSSYDTRKSLMRVIPGSVIFTEAYAYMLSNTGVFADYSKEGAFFPNANINPTISTPGRNAIWGLGNFNSAPKNRAHFLHNNKSAFAFVDGHVAAYTKGTKFDKHWRKE